MEAPPPALSRLERVAAFGLDGPDALEFRGCTPGCSVTARLGLSNVRSDGATVAVLHSAPSSLLFDVDFPVPLRLRPGTSGWVEVTYRAGGGGAATAPPAWLDFAVLEGGCGAFRVPLLTLEARLALEARARAEGSGLAPAFASADRPHACAHARPLASPPQARPLPGSPLALSQLASGAR